MRIIPVLLCVVLVTTACVGLRWIRIDSGGGRQFGPWPDGLEYACGAQAIRDTGTYYLQVGPHVVQPRYTPGWPLLLVPVLAAGVPPEQLCFVPAWFDAAHALLLGAIVFLLLTRVLDPGDRASRERRFWIALAAALVTGLGWSCTPLSMSRSRTLLSDPATALFSSAALAIALWVALRRGPLDRRAAGLLFCVGLAGGCAMAMRPIAGLLLSAPLGAVLVHLALTRGWRTACRGLAWLALGVLLPVAGVSWLMARSGYDWWQWSAYEFWVPRFYADLGTTFSFDYFFGAGHENAALARDGESRIANATFGLAMLLGLPLALPPGLGPWWPILAWTSGAWLLWSFRGKARSARLLILGMAAWPVLHFVVYGLYAFAGARFYLGVAPWPWVLLAVSAGWWCLRSRRPALALAATAVLVALVFLAVRSGVRRSIPWTWTPPFQAWFDKTKAEFRGWEQLTDAARSRMVAPVHPLVAQALGWLPRESAARIGAWGRLDVSIEHVARLLENGVIRSEETSLHRDK